MHTHFILFLLNEIHLSLCFCCLFFHLLGAEPVDTIKRADRLFSEKLYSDALPLYSHSFSLASDEESLTYLSLRLATCQLEEKKPEFALDLLRSIKHPSGRMQSLFLSGLAYRQMGEASQALDQLLQCSLMQQSTENKYVVALELGHQYATMGDLSNACKNFRLIAWEKNNPLPYYIAQLYLTRIACKNQQFEEALQILDRFADVLPEGHFLTKERLYLLGCVYFGWHKYSKAADCFADLLAKGFTSSGQESRLIQQALVSSYLRLALQTESSSESMEAILSKAEHSLMELLRYSSEEKSFLLLADFYLIKAKCLGDEESYQKAQQLFEKPTVLLSEEARQLILLKKAETAPSYQERKQILEELCTQTGSLYAYQIFCVRKGLNDFEEGIKRQNTAGNEWKADEMFEQAAAAFVKVLHQEESGLPFTALKYYILANALHSQEEKKHLAWDTIVARCKESSPPSMNEDTEEMHCIAAWLALRLGEDHILKQAGDLLQQGKEMQAPSTRWGPLLLKLDGLLSFRLKEWMKAEIALDRLLHDFPQSDLTGETRFWRAQVAEQQKNSDLKQFLLKQIYQQDPTCTYAPIAYFHMYTYREYVQGKKRAMKHLQEMSYLFPSHPLNITAYYLLGLYDKKDLLSPEGNIVRRKDYIAAIEAFQLAEDTFDCLFEKGKIPMGEISYFTTVRQHAQLERGQVNFAIALAANGGKRQIYLEYAESVCKQLMAHFQKIFELENTSRADAGIFLYPRIWAEAEYNLAQIYEEKKNWSSAELVLNRSLEHYRRSQQVNELGIMRVWIEKGNIAQQQKEYSLALQYYQEAETSNPTYLGIHPNEKLDFWIQQSMCYKESKQLEESMKLLSQVINDDVISPRRVKAMFLRAEIYELQGRTELAKKQLKATAFQGGEWAMKAQEQLEQLYE